MLKRLSLARYRGFRDFSITFGKSTYLVGPNNAGKSTILTSLRLVDAQLKHAFAKPPTLLAEDADIHRNAYIIQLEDFPSLAESVRFDFGAAEASIRLDWENDEVRLAAVWPQDAVDSVDTRNPFFYLAYKNQSQPRRPADVRRNFHTLGVVPPLSPFDHAEALLSEKHVRSNMSGRLASRHFRNHLYLLQQQNRLEEFFDFANGWTPDLQLASLRISGSPSNIDVFYTEGARGLEREIVWAGDGMHVWWQILHHVFRSDDLPTLILDEPEVYLHPDLQRRLVRLLEHTQKQVIVATHSSELLAEVDPQSMALVDRSHRSAKRMRTNTALTGLADQLGSRFNLALAKALRSRCALFLEGQDAKYLRTTAKTLGLTELANELGVAVIEMDGFSPHEHVEAFEWLCRDLLSNTVTPYVILDSDYKSSTELDHVRSKFAKLGVNHHIWTKKEVESYLLQPDLVARVAGITTEQAQKYLRRATKKYRSKVSSQLATHRAEADRTAKLDKASILEMAAADFGRDWKSLDFRLARSPAKSVLARLNEQLRVDGRGSVGFGALASRQQVDEVDPEMRRVLGEVQALLI